MGAETERSCVEVVDVERGSTEMVIGVRFVVELAASGVPALLVLGDGECCRGTSARAP